MKDWQAVYVKPRTEKKVLERLQKQYSVFCPIKSEKRKWSDRVKLVEFPLLPGYLFFQGNETERLGILQDENVVRSVFWNNKPAVIYDYEIEALRSLLTGYSDFEMSPLRIGERAKILDGAFTNKTGEVLEIKGKKVRLKLHSMGLVLEATTSVENIKRTK